MSPPDAPSDVSVSATTINSFTISWTAETGKTYRVEREAAFLFSYRVWQTVADNLSSGSFTENELPCDLFYVFQVRAKIAGSAYGVGTRVLGPAQACLSSASGGAGGVRAVGTPMPQLRIVTDNPEQDSIQIRLLLYGSPDEVYNPIPDMDMFQVDRSERYAGSGNAVFPSPAIRREERVAEFDWGGLECGSSYYFRARGHGNGESDGFTDEWGKWSHEHPREAQGTVHGSTRGCTLSLPPTPSNVTASITPGTGGSKYDVELSWGVLTGVASFRVERSDNGGTTWPHVTKGIPRSPHPVTDLPCDQDYVFRVSAYGDGKKYRADYGPAREVSQYTPIDTRSTRSASGSFLCTKPDVTVIPQPERKIKLKWDELGLGPGIGPEYTYKVQAIKYEGNFAIDEMTPEIGSAGTATFREIDLDNIIGGDGLADHTKGYLIRVTATVGTQTGYTELIIIDTPILRALGGSTGSGDTAGEVTLSWTDVDDVLNDTAFAATNTSGKYTFRVRRFSDSVMGPDHTSLSWMPDREVDEDPDATTSTIDGKKKLTGLKPEEIHGIQLIYTKNVTKPGFTKEVKVFAARDAYVWPSERLPRTGERVGTYPFYGHIASKTLVYRICAGTFPDDNWVTMIEKALAEWQKATDDTIRVMPDYKTGTTEEYEDCVEYGSPLEAFLLSFKQRQYSEIRMLQVPDGANPLTLNEIAADLLKYCVVEAIACVTPAKLDGRLLATDSPFQSTDMTFNKHRSTMLYKLVAPDLTSNGFRVAFNSCVTGLTGTNPTVHGNMLRKVSSYSDEYAAFSVVVHEGGHMLGIGGFELDIWDLGSWHEAAHPSVPLSVLNRRKPEHSLCAVSAGHHGNSGAVPRLIAPDIQVRIGPAANGEGCEREAGTQEARDSLVVSCDGAVDNCLFGLQREW